MARGTRKRQIEILAEGLVKEGALQFGEVTLPDGRESPYYVNLRGLASYPGTYKAVVDSMVAIAAEKSKGFQALCGVPVSGLMLAPPIALALSKPLLYLRTSKRSNDRAIEGQMKPGWSFLLVDDLVDSGNTLLKAADVIRAEGGEVKHALVFIDRLEGAKKKLAKSGIALHSVTDILELAKTLNSMQSLSDDDLRTITKAVGGR